MCGEEPRVFPVGDGIERYKVKTYFHNIYSDKIVHVIICPSHQLKNMIAAQYYSRDLGTKIFTSENSTFGWSQIVDMYKRELQRAENNEIRRVPDLLASHIYRDKWTLFKC